MRVSAVLVVALLTVVCGAVPALAVDEGVPDFDGHPNVGVLGFDPDGPGPEPANFWCTGMVVSDHVFLTAAHCIAAMPPETQWAVTLHGGAPATPVARPGRIFDDFPFPFSVPSVSALETVLHPRFGGLEARSHDVAVVLFPQDTFAGVTPVELPRAHQLDRLARGGDLRGQTFRLVGFGGDPEWGNGAPVVVFEGYRQTATAPFKRLTGRQLQLDGRPKVTGQGGLCLGDSGSPQFLGDANVALSLLSEHGENCVGTIRGQRLDTPSERKFLANYVDLP
jgi:hypothetical protein